MDNIRNLEELFTIWKNAHVSEIDTSYISGTVPKTAFLSNVLAPGGCIWEN